MKDFTLDIYKELLNSLKQQEYAFQTFEMFINDPKQKVIMLRHDVDARKLHSLAFAKIQHDMGIVGTYYFRMVPESYDEKVIREIADLGHEIGYHYEDMDFAHGNPTVAIDLFKTHLERLRNVAKVTTICMHGSPKSSYDNKDVWKHYDYKAYGIIAEPYFDINFNKVYYITDTGRMWDGFKVSVRDKVTTAVNWPEFHHTKEVINAINAGQFPMQVMMNFHPQRWTNNTALWYRELITQSAKNLVKRYFFVKSST